MIKAQQLRSLLQEGGFYGITGGSKAGRGNVEDARMLVQAGAKLLQYREKFLSKGQMHQELVEIRALTQKAGVALVVNDHLDLCLAVGAEGLHLGQDDLPLEVARRLVGPDLVLGWSTHNLDQVKLGLASSADYLGVGPLFATQTKPHEPVAGLEFGRQAAALSSLPLVGIGGIKAGSVPAVLQAGIKNLCLVQEFFCHPDPQALVAQIGAKVRQTFSLQA